MKKNYSNRNLKFLAVFSFTLIFLALILIKNSPANGYELSIYTVTPFIWILLVVIIVCGILISTDQMFSKNVNDFWIVGFFIILFSVFIIVSIHALRGYYMYGFGDVPTHLSEANQIIYSGHLFHGITDNFYPIIHILIAEIVIATNISTLNVGKYLAPVFTIFYMVSIYLLSNIVMPRREHIIIASIGSGILFFSYYHVMPYPQVLSALVLPFVFYLYFRSKKYVCEANKITLIILIFLITFFHPLSLIMCIAFLVTVELTLLISNKLKGVDFKMSQFNFNLTLISITVFIFWISAFSVFRIGIQDIVSTTHGVQSYQVTQVESATSSIQLFDMMILALKRYGENAIYGLLSLIGGTLVIRRLKNEVNCLCYIFQLFIWFTVSGILLIMMFAGIHQIYINRVLDSFYALLVSPLLAGFALIELLRKFKYRRILIRSLLTFTLLISIFGAYNSPWISQPSWHITLQDINGAVWLSENSGSAASEGMGFHSGDLSVAMIEHNLPHMKLFRPDYENNERMLPEKFNYSLYQELGSLYIKDCYLVTEIRAEISADDPVLSKYKLDPTIPWGRGKDLENLQTDCSVDKIYESNEMKCWYIHPKNGLN
jgi:hypothetical protein